MSVADPCQNAASHEGPGRSAWSFASAEAHDLDPAALDRAADRLALRGERQGIVIVHEGVIVFERYWANAYHRATPEWKNVSFSSGKSWGSTMVGRAYTEGLLKLDDLAAQYHPCAVSGLRPEVTIRHILTMTSGGTLKVKPSTRPPKKLTDATPPEPGDEYRWTKPGAPDAPEGYGVSLRAGTTFHYDGAPADHLANVIHGASGTPSLVYMMEHVIGPMGCENFEYQWEGIDKTGNVRIGGSILMSCRDFARLGQLYLNGGRWGGAELIDPLYISGATTPSPLNLSYGYLWWLNVAGRIPNAPTTMFYAAGARGQFCFVLPEHDLVIATMGFGKQQLSGEQAWDALAPVLPR